MYPYLERTADVAPDQCETFLTEGDVLASYKGGNRWRDWALEEDLQGLPEWIRR